MGKGFFGAQSKCRSYIGVVRNDEQICKTWQFFTHDEQASNWLGGCVLTSCLFVVFDFSFFRHLQHSMKDCSWPTSLLSLHLNRWHHPRDMIVMQRSFPGYTPMSPKGRTSWYPSMMSSSVLKWCRVFARLWAMAELRRLLSTEHLRTACRTATCYFLQQLSFRGMLTLSLLVPTFLVCQPDRPSSQDGVRCFTFKVCSHHSRVFWRFFCKETRISMHE